MKKTVLLLTTVLLLMVTAVTIGATPAATGATPNPYMATFPLTEPAGAPRHIVAESSSKAWFTAPGINAVGSLVITSTVDYDFTFYNVPPGSDPYDLAVTADDVWFTLRAANQIGRLNKTTGNITYYDVPTANSVPTGIDVAPAGMVWFAQENGNKLGRLNPTSGNITEYLYDRPDAQLHDVAVQSDTIIRATAPGVERVIAYVITQNFEGFLEESTAETNSQARYMAMSGNVAYISAENSNLVGRYAPGTLMIWRWYTPPSPNSGLSAIAFGNHDGLNRIWVAQRNINRVLLIQTASGGAPIFIWEESLPSANSQPTGLALAQDGTLWLTAPGSNEIVVWAPPYLDLARVYLPVVLR